MTLTPGERLRRLLAAVAPTEGELGTAERRVQRIAARLNRDFDIRRMLAVGSHWKGTAVRRYSDVDLFVVMSRDEARKWAPTLASSTLIGRVRRSIMATYPQTGLRVDKQAVRVAFEQGSHAVDVVPAIFEDFDSRNQVPTYLIPDGDSGWIRTAPDLHKKLIDQANQASGRKLKQLVRLLKWWSASRVATMPLSSLYLEWFAIRCEIPVAYTCQESLAAIFAAMVRAELPPLKDPWRISDAPVRAAKTNIQQRAILQVASQSAARAQQAIKAEARGLLTAAIDYWSMLFNRRFPSSLG